MCSQAPGAGVDTKGAIGVDPDFIARKGFLDMEIEHGTGGDEGVATFHGIEPQVRGEGLIGATKGEEAAGAEDTGVGHVLAGAGGHFEAQVQEVVEEFGAKAGLDDAVEIHDSERGKQCHFAFNQAGLFAGVCVPVKSTLLMDLIRPPVIEEVTMQIANSCGEIQTDGMSQQGTRVFLSGNNPVIAVMDTKLLAETALGIVV